MNAVADQEGQGTRSETVPGWPGRWGALSFSAPFLAMFLTLVVTRGMGRDDPETLAAVVAVNLVLFGAGLLLGIAAVIGSVQAGRRGWMIRSMLGTLLNAMALANAAAMWGESGF